MLHFPVSIVSNFRLTKIVLKKGFCDAAAMGGTSEANDGCRNESLVFLYIVTFVHLSGRGHLCLLFFFLFKVFLQALAICTVLESEFRQDVQLQSSMKMKKTIK